MTVEGGWSIDHDGAGSPVFVAPTGQPATSPPPHEWHGQILTWLQEWADAHHLDLGPDANLPLWGGTRPDYDWAVGALLAAE